jgi:hypothetical protein
MTAWVLVLAGVTAGDGGQGMGTAREAVSVMPRPDVQWDGTCRDENGLRWHAWLREGHLSRGSGSVFFGSDLVAFKPDGRAVFDLRQVGAYRLEGDRLVIRTHGRLFVLWPAASQPQPQARSWPPGAARGDVPGPGLPPPRSPRT